MAYEREAVEASPTPVQSAQPTFRDEKILSPYVSGTRLSKAIEKVTTTTSGQTNTISEGVIEEPKTTAETVTLSPQMAALARKEQKFRQQQQDFKARETALEAEKAEIAEFKAMKAKLAEKDYSAVEGLVDYDAYTNYLINKGVTVSPEQQALKKLEAEVADVKKAHLEDVSKRFEAAITDRRNAVKSLIESNKEFKRIKGLGAQEAVVQHILDTWENDEIDLSPEQAAKEVEELLKEREQKWLAISKEEPEPNPEQVEGKKELPPLKSGIKTLTNTMAATGEIKRPVKPLHLMSDAERYAEARHRVEEKLKQQQKQ